MLSEDNVSPQAQVWQYRIYNNTLACAWSVLFAASGYFIGLVWNDQPDNNIGSRVVVVPVPPLAFAMPPVSPLSSNDSIAPTPNTADGSLGTPVPLNVVPSSAIPLANKAVTSSESALPMPASGPRVIRMPDNIGTVSDANRLPVEDISGIVDFQSPKKEVPIINSLQSQQVIEELPAPSAFTSIPANTAPTPHAIKVATPTPTSAPVPYNATPRNNPPSHPLVTRPTNATNLLPPDFRQ